MRNNNEVGQFIAIGLVVLTILLLSFSYSIGLFINSLSDIFFWPILLLSLLLIAFVLIAVVVVVYSIYKGQMKHKS